MKTKIMTMVAIAIGTLFATAAESNYFVAKTTAYGQLAEVLGDKATEIDSLVVEGPIDENDFFTMWSCSFYDNLKIINLEKADIKDKTIPDNAFWHIEEQQQPVDYKRIKLYKIILPDDLCEIGAWAFGYTDIRYINLPQSLKKIGKGVFFCCRYLDIDELILPEGTEDVWFCCTSHIKKLVIPGSVKRIKQMAFFGSGIDEIVCEEGVEGIDFKAFEQSNITKITLPSTCTDLSVESFIQCYDLNEICMADGVTEIPNNFCHHNGLKRLEIPKTVKTIGTDAFWMCRQLTDLILHEGLETIGQGAFSTTSLTSIFIPSTVTTIENMAFDNCSEVSKICSAATIPPSLGANADGDDMTFRYDPVVYKNMPVYVPIGTAEAYRNAPGWKSFENFIETDDFSSTSIENITIDDNQLYGVSTDSGQIVISLDKSAPYSVYDMTGRVIATGVHNTLTTILCAKGLFIVNVDGKVVKVMVR